MQNRWFGLDTYVQSCVFCFIPRHFTLYFHLAQNRIKNILITGRGKLIGFNSKIFNLSKIGLNLEKWFLPKSLFHYIRTIWAQNEEEIGTWGKLEVKKRETENLLSSPFLKKEKNPTWSYAVFTSRFLYNFMLK